MDGSVKPRITTLAHIGQGPIMMAALRCSPPDESMSQVSSS